jgi:translation elongation factor EF-Tu-like GTPase
LRLLGWSPALSAVDERISDAHNQPPFWFGIDSCFTVPGRGTVVGGAVLSGSVATGDVVDLVHDGRTVRTTVDGTVAGDGRLPDGKTYPFVGLVLQVVRRFAVAPDDYVPSLGVVGFSGLSARRRR